MVKVLQQNTWIDDRKFLKSCVRARAEQGNIDHPVPPDVAHLSAGRLWDCTAQVRKLCVVLFYVQPIFLVVCSLIYASVYYVASFFTNSTYTLCSLCRHCIDLVLGVCVLAMAMQDNKCMYLVPYAIQMSFLAEYTAIRYLFQQTYLLTVFVCLY